jgi:hypothetical protein
MYVVGESLVVRLALCLLALSLWCGAAQGADAAVSGERALAAKYATISGKLEKNQFGAPIYLESVEHDDSLRVEMYGIFNQPFAAVRDALQSPANWCDITSLHINIKSCTWKKSSDQWLLTLYSGRKYYQPPADAYPLLLKFNVVSQKPDYLDLALAADHGPLHTRDHRIRLEATPLDKGRTFIHFSYVYSHGKMARMAIKTYFATLARDKVGFSLVAGEGGNPVYISGVRGAIERNAVRYYLALQTYMDTLKYPEGQRFEQRISRWYDLTTKYARQLKESEKGEYLAGKRQERSNQILLQNELK